MPYYFFLSYARGTIDDDVEKFFKDLSAEVRDRAGLNRNEEVGFLDRHSIELGSRWPQQLVRALSECRTFVALCTPRYFLSDACGKEWSVFEERLRRYEETENCHAPMLIPLLWLPTKRMPERAQVRQYENDRLDPAYQQDGLRQLIRLKMHSDAYITAVSVLARHIVDQAENHRVPVHTGSVEFSSVSNAFQPEADDSVGRTDAAVSGELESAPKTSRYVHFVVAAPSRHEVKNAHLRRNLSFYGDSRPDWAPFQPPVAIAHSARIIASEQNFESGVATIEGLTERMHFARANNQMIVLLVDAWAAKLPDHRRALVECDSWDPGSDESPPSAVMVPSSHQDEETRANWWALSNDLRIVFVNRFARSDDRMFRASVLSFPAFDADLRVALSVAQNRMHVHGTPHQRLPEDEGPPGIPTLGLPDLPSQ